MYILILMLNLKCYEDVQINHAPWTALITCGQSHKKVWQWQTFSEFLHQKLYEVFDFKAKSGIGEFKNT